MVAYAVPVSMGSTAKKSAPLGRHMAGVAYKAAAVFAGAVVVSFASSARAQEASASAPAPAFVLASSPSAAPQTDKAPTASPPRHRTFGMTMDVGVPDGAALGLVVRPRFDWLRIAGAVTHNGIAPGLRLGVTVDPIDFPIAPTLTVEGGHYWQGTIPGVSDSPTVGYNYANIHLGLEIGSRSAFRFFLRGGVSYVDVSASNISMGSNGTVAANGASAMSGSGIGNPSFSGWVAPSGKLGFALYF
jgi:hypothetical protein